VFRGKARLGESLTNLKYRLFINALWVHLPRAVVFASGTSAIAFDACGLCTGRRPGVGKTPFGRFVLT